MEMYKDVFTSVAMLPKDEIRKKFGDVLFEIVMTANRRSDYPYIEPSELENIPEYWQKPINDTIHTSIFGVGTVKIADCVKLTMQHIANA